MDNDTKYDILNNYVMKTNSVSGSVRIYSDGEPSVCICYEDRYINLDGDFDLVYTCLKSLCKEAAE